MKEIKDLKAYLSGVQDGEGNFLSAPFEFTYTDNITLYAQYVPNVYLVMFDRQGGFGGSEGVNAVYGEDMTKASAPVRLGYAFFGYFTEPGGQGTKYYNADMTSAHNWDIAVTPEHASGLLYAYWQGIECVITFDFDGGYGGTTQIMVRYGEEMPTEGLVFPEKDGYKFGGYFLRPQWEVQQYYTGDFQSAQPWNRITDTTLYAAWSRID